MSAKTQTPKPKPPKTVAPKKGLPLFPIVIGGVVLIGLIAVIVAVMSGGDDDSADVPTGTEQNRPVTVDGETLPAFDGGPGDEDAAIGETAPTLTGENFAGDPVTIGPDGSPKMVAFVAHWCPHCQREVPRIQEWRAAHGVPDGVELFFVSTNVNKDQVNYPPSAWLTKEGVSDVPTIADDAGETALAAFGGGSFPFIVYLDGDNKVLLRTSGEYGEDSEAYTPVFEALANGEAPTDPRL